MNNFHQIKQYILVNASKIQSTSQILEIINEYGFFQNRQDPKYMMKGSIKHSNFKNCGRPCLGQSFGIGKLKRGKTKSPF